MPACHRPAPRPAVAPRNVPRLSGPHVPSWDPAAAADPFIWSARSFMKTGDAPQTAFLARSTDLLVIGEQDVAVDGTRWRRRMTTSRDLAGDVAKFGHTACSGTRGCHPSRCGPCGSSALRVVRKLKQRGGDRWMPRLAGHEELDGAKASKLGPTRAAPSSPLRCTKLCRPASWAWLSPYPVTGENSWPSATAGRPAAYFAPYLENSYRPAQASATDEPRLA